MRMGSPEAPVKLPEHCDVFGVMHERTGVDGQHYGIHFHLRLPTQWNHEFLFQGGAGTNGDAGDALGHISLTTPPALAQGFAVVSQDGGHDNTVDADPARGGAVAFGFDPQARADFGRYSLPVVSNVAKALLRGYYDEPARRSYFVGCSKGGQEGLVFAEQFPQEFDGILAADPGLSLPRAALSQIWDVQAFGSVVPREPGAATLMPARLPITFSATDLRLVHDAVLAACDADDGLKDGIVGAFAQCTDSKVLPELRKRTCEKGKDDGCLSTAQISALRRSLQGPRDSRGRHLYSDWPWDAGIGSDGWRLWKLGQPGGMPALNLLVGGPAVAAVFTTPPTALRADPQSALDYAMRFNFERDAARIYAVDAEHAHSAWDDVSARSSDLTAFRARGGKMIIPHGVSDPVFSINDTLTWYREIDARTGGRAAEFVRVFPIPGMAHCAGGPATDHFDAFTALRTWVEQGKAPERIEASAGPQTPWPGRSRPLCPYPAIARYSGHGDVDRAAAFVCER